MEVDIFISHNFRKLLKSPNYNANFDYCIILKNRRLGTHLLGKKIGSAYAQSPRRRKSTKGIQGFDLGQKSSKLSHACVP
jgi:hypothetical protein